MTNIRRTLVRIFVSDLDAARPLYERLTGQAATRRFSFNEGRGDVELVQVGNFLLWTGPPEATDPYRRLAATTIVTDMTQVLDALDELGGTRVRGPIRGPYGQILFARHPDGAEFEYIEEAAAAQQQP